MKGSSELLAAMILATIVLASLTYLAVQWTKAQKDIVTTTQYVQEKATLQISISCTGEFSTNGTIDLLCSPLTNFARLRKPQAAYFVIDADGDGLWEYICPATIANFTYQNFTVISNPICASAGGTLNITKLNDIAGSSLVLVYRVTNFVGEAKLVCQLTPPTTSNTLASCGIVIAG